MPEFILFNLYSIISQGDSTVSDENSLPYKSYNYIVSCLANVSAI